MPFGPGKYDDECTKAREATGGNVLLIVLDGNKGDGFACHATLSVAALVPKLLRTIADEIEKSLPAKK